MTSITLKVKLIVYIIAMFIAWLIAWAITLALPLPSYWEGPFSFGLGGILAVFFSIWVFDNVWDD